MSNPSRDPLDADLRDLTMLLPQILRTLRSGIGGVIERFLSRRFLLRLYREELANLEREAQRAG